MRAAGVVEHCMIIQVISMTCQLNKKLNIFLNGLKSLALTKSLKAKIRNKKIFPLLQSTCIPQFFLHVSVKYCAICRKT